MGLIAVTGGTGFIGSSIVRRLTSDPDLQVRILCRDLDCGSTGGGHVHGDITDARACAALVEGADAVIHAAALVRSTDAAALQRINVDGTRTLVRAAADAHIRSFVHVSTTGVYGRPGVVVTEDTTTDPAGKYEQSKADADLLVRSTIDPGRLTIVRPSNVVGPGHPLQPLRRFLHRVKDGHPVVHAGAWVNYVSVDDVAAVIHAIVRSSGDRPREVIVNVPMDLGAFVRVASLAMGSDPPIVELPRFAGRVIRGPVRWLGGAVPQLDRLEALLDQTRFVTIHGDWFERHHLVPALDSVIRSLAEAYGIARR